MDPGYQSFIGTDAFLFKTGVPLARHVQTRLARVAIVAVAAKTPLLEGERQRCERRAVLAAAGSASPPVPSHSLVERPIARTDKETKAAANALSRKIALVLQRAPSALIPTLARISGDAWALTGPNYVRERRRRLVAVIRTGSTSDCR